MRGAGSAPSPWAQGSVCAPTPAPTPGALEMEMENASGSLGSRCLSGRLPPSLGSFPPRPPRCPSLTLSVSLISLQADPGPTQGSLLSVTWLPLGPGGPASPGVPGEPRSPANSKHMALRKMHPNTPHWGPSQGAVLTRPLQPQWPWASLPRTAQWRAWPVVTPQPAAECRAGWHLEPRLLRAPPGPQPLTLGSRPGPSTCTEPYHLVMDLGQGPRPRRPCHQVSTGHVSPARRGPPREEPTVHPSEPRAGLPCGLCSVSREMPGPLAARSPARRPLSWTPLERAPCLPGDAPPTPSYFSPAHPRPGESALAQIFRENSPGVSSEHS